MFSTILGECEYKGKKGKAIREVNGDTWRFVIIINGERHHLATF